VKKSCDSNTSTASITLLEKSKEQEILNGIAAKGLKPEDIDVVILTHLHFDHIGNTELFTNARFIVQRSEIPMLISPPKFATFYYREWSHKITNISDRLIPIEGNLKFSKHVELIRVGGHSPNARQDSTARDRQTSARVPDQPWRSPAEVKRWAVLPISRNRIPGACGAHS
jgi:ribonuclease BN (tRNA processing enzyme)